MNQNQRARIRAREQARETVGRATRWGVAAALVTAAVCGLGLGIDAAGPADAGATNPPQPNTVSSGDVQQNHLQPPQQAPLPANTGGSDSSSGGS
ncbi:MAG TPA: hypothetical protein VG674_28015 [Amycolatopsis sp.]|nr:hypothetical protein [Amycolatopsis sp.]